MTTEGPIEVAVVDAANNELARLTLPEAFSADVREGAMFEQIMAQRASRRRGTASTKTRGRISGGGAKPWRQKGTGRARAGSNRSPIWRGGGTIFGPQPRSYAYRLPRSARRVALRSALAMKAQQGLLRVVDGLSFDAPKTKSLAGVLQVLGLAGTKTLIVTATYDRVLELCARNLVGVKVLATEGLNVEDVVGHENLLLCKDSLEAVGERVN